MTLARRCLARLAIALVISGATAPALAACPGSPPPSDAGAAVTEPATGNGVAAVDDLGRCVILAAPAQRIVTLTPHAAELVYAAGGGDRLVGTVDHSDHPAPARELPRVGDALQLNPESLLALRPDLIIGWQAGAMTGVEPALRAVGIPVFYSAPRRLTDIPDNLEKLGILMGTRDVARPAAAELRQRIAALERRHAGADTLTVFVQIGMHPLYTLNDTHIVSDVLRVCGAHNIAGAHQVIAPMVALETVLAARPDIILTPRDLPAAADYWRRYAPALRAPLLAIEGDLMYRPGPRLVTGAEALCERIEAVRRHRD